MRNVIAVLCVTMLGGLFACTQENSPPTSYGVGNNYAGAGTSYGNRNGIYIATFVDVQDAMTEEVSENDSVVEKDLAENDLSSDSEVGCTGSVAYCACMLTYDDEYCTCKEETPESQTLFCECTLKVCVATPDPDMAGQYSTFCAQLYPTECEGF